MSELGKILQKAVDGGRLEPSEGLTLMASSELAQIGQAADAVSRRLHPEPYRTYNIDRNINYTNICVGGCKFCAFARESGQLDAWVLRREDLYQKIEETLALGGDQILLQGGMHPDWRIDWYEQLLRDVKSRFPSLNIHGFSPPEICHIAKMSRLPVEEVLRRLRDAGLGSLPGGGAEILVDRVRQTVSPCKATVDDWLGVCRAWHRLGGRGSATMMFGHIETLADRIEHLDRIRQLQDETGGFTAFIPWTFQPEHTPMADRRRVGSFEYLKVLAISRLYLDNVANIQSGWVTEGLKVAQIGLRFGANDLGSLMIEENVVAAAGTRFRVTEEQMRRAIAETGYEPRQRDVLYRLKGGREGPSRSAESTLE